MSQQVTWVNGQRQDVITLDDRAVQYGDGFFTTILVANKKLLNWSGHWWRIQNSCQLLQLPLIELALLTDWLEAALEDYFKQNAVSNCVLKICFTRGVGGIGYQMPEPIQTNCLFYIKPSAIEMHQGQLTAISPMAIGLCQTQASIGSLAGVKSLNRLENVMARTEMANSGYLEGLMLNAKQQVICATQSNLYIVKGKNVFTPEIVHSGVAGTTAYQINGLLESLGHNVQQKPLNLSDIEQADELFLTNAVKGVQPVKQFLTTQYYATTISQQIHQAWSKWQDENALTVNCLKSIQ